MSGPVALGQASGDRKWLRAFPVRAAVAVAVVALAGAAVACGGGGGSAGSRTEGGSRAIPLRVLQGPRGATLALVPVYISQKGPFLFALDTGASTSLVDERVAMRLNLPTRGRSTPVSGIVSSTSAILVRVSQWRVGNVMLRPRMVTSLPLASGNGTHGLQGLLGSDILSQFGSITIDYGAQKLVLRPDAVVRTGSTAG